MAVVEEARAQGWESILIMEDDVVFAEGFHEEFQQRLCGLPADWDMLFFGCLHYEPPEPAAPGIGRLRVSFSTFMYAVRRTVYDAFIFLNRRERYPVDKNNLFLQRRFRCYCFMPHLAWVDDSYSDAQGVPCTHWYIRFRILHAGSGPSHVHHLHAHQWLRSPDSDSSSYLDSQLLVPGTAFTLEITYNGSGNRNKTVGDSIFHCHFYPHFAQGMWALWRVHDVFEEGTKLDPDGRPEAGINRALPDGEIERGTPIPAIVPLPTLAMAPMPAKVQLTDLSPWKPGQRLGRRVEVIPEETKPDGEKVYKNPGFPFFVPGVSGHRPPHPPLDFAWLEDPATRLPVYDDQGKKISLDGGLPRHLVLDGKVVKEFHTRWDFSKDTALRDAKGEIVKGGGSLTAMEVPEEGTPVLAAMKEHSIRTRPMAQPNGEMGNFILNGLPPTNGAPFADPGVNDQGNANVHRRRYQGAVFQSDTVFNKKSWHYPQQRMISLWQDVAPTIDKTRAPEPFFFRTNTSDSIQFWHTTKGRIFWFIPRTLLPAGQTPSLRSTHRRGQMTIPKMDFFSDRPSPVSSAKTSLVPIRSTTAMSPCRCASSLPLPARCQSNSTSRLPLPPSTAPIRS